MAVPGIVETLPSSVLDALRRNRKIEAIKRLREERKLDLKDAKAAVDAFVAEHPEYGPPAKGSRTETGIGRLVIATLAIAAAYAWYRWSGS